MFGKKLILIAAAVALTVSHVAAVEEATHIKVHVSAPHHKAAAHKAVPHKAAAHKAVHKPVHKAAAHKPVHKAVTHKKQENVTDSHEWTEESSGEGSEGGEEVIDIEIITDGSNTGAEGDNGHGPIAETYCIEGWSEISVEGVEGKFCAYGDVCVADIDGSCPEPQYGLDFGAYCDVVETGVMGCKPVTEQMWWEAQGNDDGEIGSGGVCGEGASPMSVEGVEGVFCVEGQACVADIDGACPAEQDGLEYGAYCGTVLTGVKGCKPVTEEMYNTHSIPTGDNEEGTVEVDICIGDDASPMSVEGVEGVFCVEGQACVADILGACPGPQDGLEYGAYCGTVASGVNGCIPYTEEAPVEEPTEEDFCSAEGDSQMSVEGVEGIFCVNGQACVADIDGACPGPQDGLEYGAYCGTVASGVKGCKPNTSKLMAKHHKVVKHFAKKHHAKAHSAHVAKVNTKNHAAKKTGHSIKVVNVHAAKKTVEHKKKVVAHKKH